MPTTKRTTKSSSSSSKISKPPTPFTSAPEHLRTFLNTLLKTKVYLTHLDANPIQLKRTVFTVPVLLNLAFVVLLAWRVVAGLPFYYRSLLALYHLQLEQGSIFGHGGWSFVRREAWLAANFGFDWLLATIVAPWPWTFFFDPEGSPVAWRLGVGFKLKELIVRGSRTWGNEDLLDGEKRGDQSPFWVTRVLPYVALENISKTGYLLMDKNWDLEFGAMLRGQRLIDKGDLKEDDLNGKMWIWWGPKEGGEWVMWDFRAVLYTKEGAEPTSEDVQEGRVMVEKFRDELVNMDKEELFWKWVELVHYESSKPGGFTKERQEEVGRKVKELFGKYNVDWDEFETKVGIVDNKLVI